MNNLNRIELHGGRGNLRAVIRVLGQQWWNAVTSPALTNRAAQSMLRACRAGSIASG
jgi:hypothetical protein